MRTEAPPAGTAAVPLEEVAPDAVELIRVSPDVLRHRLVLTYEAEAEEVTSDDLVQRLLDTVEVP